MTLNSSLIPNNHPSQGCAVIYDKQKQHHHHKYAANTTIIVTIESNIYIIYLCHKSFEINAVHYRRYCLVLSWT